MNRLNLAHPQAQVNYLPGVQYTGLEVALVRFWSGLPTYVRERIPRDKQAWQGIALVTVRSILAVFVRSNPQM
jgi:hypothetical protein